MVVLNVFLRKKHSGTGFKILKWKLNGQIRKKPSKTPILGHFRVFCAHEIVSMHFWKKTSYIFDLYDVININTSSLNNFEKS